MVFSRHRLDHKGSNSCHRLERLDRDRGISKPSFRFTGLGLLDFLLDFFTTENDRIASTGKRERTSYLTDRIEPPEVEP